MYEKAKIFFEKFKVENLVKYNSKTQLERITEGKTAVLQTVVYSDANKGNVLNNQMKKTNVKKK